jgi:hypothetical protein
LSQYYQQHQQYPGPAGYAPSDVAAFARQNAEFMAAQQQMNPAYSNFYNQAALYSQAQAWQHAWQMQKFQVIQQYFQYLQQLEYIFPNFIGRIRRAHMQIFLMKY